MNDPFIFAAQNTVVAAVLALFIYGLSRVWRNPPVAHVLWLMVLLKLVAPPLVSIDWPIPAREEVAAERLRTEPGKLERFVRVVDRTTTWPPAYVPTTGSGWKQREKTGGLRQLWKRSRPVLLWLWVGGAALFALVAATRIVRFERLLRGTLPASERSQRLAADVAGKLGLRRAPDLRSVEAFDVPFVWWAGRRATIVLPIRLCQQFDRQQLALILAHELTHLRRRDHWVRAVELIVSTVYWWNPLVWIIRRQIHQAEDLCCDAWVREVYPDCAKSYAEVVLKTAESLSASPVGPRLLPASPFLQSISLKARIEMILQSRFAPRVSRKSLVVLALIALFVLPTFVQTTRTQARADGDEKPPKATAPTLNLSPSSEFPFKVKFEQGATRFLKGDNITIVEIRGTAKTFTPGNIYWINGKYTLASHDRAALAAYTTAIDAANATGYSFKVQQTVVDKGDGTFTLFLPMSCRGLPHVSFYPADGGEGFGGNYFGTGDSVLKQWWGEKESD